MIEKVSTLEKLDMGSVRGGADVSCSCDCDSPGCADWIAQGIAITAAAASSFFVQP